MAHRARLREQMLGALDSLAQLWAADHEFGRAIAVTRRIVELEPWREAAHRQLMWLLAHDGQRDAALVQYERCRQALRTELAVAPEAETTALYEQLRAGEIATSNESQPPAIPAPQPRHNLSTPTTPLLGRTAEIAQLLQLFADPGRRLICIVAPGGMGKSHLAIAVATEMLPQFADGVYFVALAPLTDTGTIAPTIAASVGYTFQSDGRSPKAQLLDYLRAKELLLLLDNAEHLLDGVTLFTEILQAAPKVRLLVTSRERLRLSSETVFALEGLALIDGDGEQESAAADLFVQAAQRARLTFEPTAADWPAIQQICQLVGGTPLGLILAAAWIELLSPAEIATEISCSLDFLTAELRDMPARHHSLRAVFETTWQRLSEEERAVFQKLAIFRGGFTREAAERVAAASLATLTTLMYKALIQYQPNQRYEMHELLRQFALETLADQLAAVRDKHSAYFCDFLTQRDADLKGARQQTAMAELEADSENIRAAWQWAVQRDQFEALTRALDSLGLFYLRRSRLDEGAALCQLVVERLDQTLYDESTGGQSGDGQPIQARCYVRILIWKSTFQRRLQEIKTALMTLMQAEELLRRHPMVGLDPRSEQAQLLLERAEAVLEVNFAECRAVAQQSLTLYRTLNDRWRMAQAIAILGEALKYLGQFDRARQLHEEGLALRQALGDLLGIADTLEKLGGMARNAGNFAEAEMFLDRSIRMFEALNERAQMAHGIVMFAVTLVHAGKFAESLQLFDKGRSIHRSLNLPGEPGISTTVQGFALMHLGRYTEATDNFQRVIASYPKIAIGFALKNLGRIALAKSEYGEAQEKLHQALDLFRGRGDSVGLGQTFGCLGCIALRLHNLPEATTCIRKNLQIAADSQIFLPSMTALCGVALLRAAAGDGAGAVELYTVALQNGHVANSHWYYDVVGRQIDEIAASLPPGAVAAARVRSRAQDWRMTIQSLWAERSRHDIL